MNLTAEFERARAFVLTKFTPNGHWTLFEFIIRYLGGLLSASDLTGDPDLTATAIALGQAILKAIEPLGGNFNSWTFSVQSRSINKFRVQVMPGMPCTAEIGTFQVEFLTLARLTGDARFAKVAFAAYRALWKSPNTSLIAGHIGVCEDSYYEYLIKSYVLTGGESKELLRRYLLTAAQIRDRLLFKTIHRELHGIGQAGDPKPRPFMEHLSTFAAGMLAVGSVKDNPNAIGDLELADKLALTYATVYREMKSGVAPDQVLYNVDDKANEREFWVGGSAEYMLRPESVESVYVMWKFTGLQKYRDYAWDMFLGINRSCRVEFGFASIMDATKDKSDYKDDMESFFLAETLKYLYLTFSDSEVISPANWVFNTEGHPVKMWDAGTIEKFRKMLQDVGTA